MAHLGTFRPFESITLYYGAGYYRDDARDKWVLVSFGFKVSGREPLTADEVKRRAEQDMTTRLPPDGTWKPTGLVTGFFTVTP